MYTEFLCGGLTSEGYFFKKYMSRYQIRTTKARFTTKYAFELLIRFQYWYKSCDKSWLYCSPMRSRCILPLCQVQVHSATMQLQLTWTSAMAIASHDKCVYHCFSYSRKFMGTLARVKDKFIDYGGYVDCDLLMVRCGKCCFGWLWNVFFFSWNVKIWFVVFLMKWCFKMCIL